MFHRRQGLPDDWLDLVEEHLGVWALLDEGEQDTVAGTADWLLRHKHWEAANGFELTDMMRVTIAAQAALLVLGLDVDELRDVSAVIVYPSAMVSRGLRAGPAMGTVSDGDVPILGEAHERRGPVLLAWDDAYAAASAPGRGRNVVLHEFAHKLDMVDHMSDGVPAIGHRVDPARWYAVCTEVFDAITRGHDRPPLDPYAGTNPAEFFAVATEVFFDVPTELQHHEADLYDLLRDYYGQDPAERLRRV